MWKTDGNNLLSFPGCKTYCQKNLALPLLNMNIKFRDEDRCNWTVEDEVKIDTNLGELSL